eukprot:471111-Karenia_brevis.AAC.1
MRVLRRRQKELDSAKKVSTLKKIEPFKRKSLGQRSQRMKERRTVKSKYHQKVKGGEPRRRKIGMMTFGLKLIGQVEISVWWREMKSRTE